MSELEDRISSILNSPEEMGRIAEMARSLMGGGAAEPPPAGGEGSLLGKLSGLLGGAAGDPAPEKNNKLALIEAMGPFLGEKRRKKMSRALQIAKAAKLAGVLFAENGGDGDL